MSSPSSLRLTALVLALVATAISVAAQDVPRSYRIGARDQIQVRVDEIPDFDHERVVAEDGTIGLPTVGVVNAEGLSEDQLEEEIRRRLETQGLRRATVSITINAFRSRPVSILGAVTTPGTVSVPGRASLLELLTEAGGLDVHHGSHLLVRRTADNGLSDQVAISIRDLLEIGDPTVNIPIFSGDVIHVPPARKTVINLLGEVERSGSLEFDSSQRVTLLTAIARAGGLTENAARRIQIKRGAADGQPQEIFVDYRRVLSGKEADPELIDGDLIIVKESFF